MEEQIEKFICEKCNFKTHVKYRLKQHFDTELHKTGVRGKRSDYKEPAKCTFCDYSTKCNIALQKHILNKHKTKAERKAGYKYYCEECNFGSFYEDGMNVHINSEKHKRYAN